MILAVKTELLKSLRGKARDIERYSPHRAMREGEQYTSERNEALRHA